MAKERKTCYLLLITCYLLLTAFFNVKPTDQGNRQGYLAECDRTEVIFQNPKEEATMEYVSGRFG